VWVLCWAGGVEVAVWGVGCASGWRLVLLLWLLVMITGRLPQTRTGTDKFGVSADALGIGGLNMDIIYNIGDAVNKIGFGLVIYSLSRSAAK